jgi:hypothetical protein
MPRILMISFMLAASIVVLTSQSNAQSPDPALLAPGQSGRMLAPPRYPASRPSYASAGRNVFRSYRSLTGARLSHPPSQSDVDPGCDDSRSPPAEPMTIASKRDNGVRSCVLDCRHKAFQPAHGVHEVRDDWRRRAAELDRAEEVTAGDTYPRRRHLPPL